jgi:hypothetical protein
MADEESGRPGWRNKKSADDQGKNLVQEEVGIAAVEDVSALLAGVLFRQSSGRGEIPIPGPFEGNPKGRRCTGVSAYDDRSNGVRRFHSGVFDAVDDLLAPARLSSR